jgi:hypothetical protein
MDDSSEGWYTQEIAELLGYSYVWAILGCLLIAAIISCGYLFSVGMKLGVYFREKENQC